MQIKYVGVKQDGETAFIHDTKITWFQGDSHEIADAIAARMLKHPDVFAIDEAEKTPAVIDPSTSPAPVLLADGRANQQISPEAFITTPGGVTHALNVLDRAALHALAKELDVKVHHNAGADKVIEALQTAFPA